MQMPAAAQPDPHATLHAIARNVGTVIKGRADTIRLLLAAYAGGGHVLIEDVPGTGKTTLAKALARSLDVDFARVQFTPDLLPTDILGASIFDPRTQEFRLHRGPIFTTILLADEINRASPRTQSALLEAMAENQVSLDGRMHALDDVFMVLATQNPVEFHGTYPLPEAQMDRFAVRLSMGYLEPAQEMDLLLEFNGPRPLDALRPCASRAELASVRAAVAGVRVAEPVRRYIVDLVGATRAAPGVALGASPRASLALMKIAQALALFDGESYVQPDYVHELAVPVLAHRLVLDSQARFAGADATGIVRDLLAAVDVPR
ncbi:MAG: AAA family ATPase [Gammaproteobacteria bacterium]